MANFRRPMPDEVIQCVIQYIREPRDRASVSRVCHRWYDLDAESRKHITIAFCYSTTPQRLLERFPNLESLILKGKPRAAMFNLIPGDWGGFVTPWVTLLNQFRNLNTLHFRRMIVRDSDLETIANVKGPALQSLKLDKCSGFSTNGLLHIARSCGELKTLFLQESIIDEISGEWLHEIALTNRDLKTLNFYLTYLDQITIEDLLLIATNCPLVCLKIGECIPQNIDRLFRAATRLEEFTGGGSLSLGLNEQPVPQNYPVLSFPPQLRHVGLGYMVPEEMLLFLPIAHLLKTLDLLCALLGGEDLRMLIQRCPNLEVLEVRDVIGDEGLEILSIHCKKLKRLRIERGEDEGLADEQGAVTHRGLIALSVGCRDLEYLAVYVSDITNDALGSIGVNLKNMLDFRLVLLDRIETIADLPLDSGVRTLLIGCSRLKRFALYLRRGGLTDQGLKYIGQHSPHVTWMLLGNLGETDEGLHAFSRGCPSLHKLEMRGCLFSGRALAYASRQLKSLRYMWVQGYVASQNGLELLDMARDHWHIEIIPATQEIIAVEGQDYVQEHPAHVLGYYSLVGQRTDYPEDGSVVPLRVPQL